MPKPSMPIALFTPSFRYRIQHASLKKETLARAIGIPPKLHPSIIDATAGLGRDSLILAALGYHVTLIERSPEIHRKLSDALANAALEPAYRTIIERLKLIHVDSLTYLKAHSADVIYLDPMFPLRKKSAAVKKEMQYLQEIVGDDPDADALLTLALSCAAKRVVVKRPRLAEPLGQTKPSFSYEGNSSRFDVYLTNQPPDTTHHG